ncbi:MAG: sialidase family protein [Kiritimatiellia bacterium]
MSFRKTAWVCAAWGLSACCPLARCVADNRVPGVPPPIDAAVVEARPGYNSWPMLQNVGARLVCVYSRGRRHTIHEGERDAVARFSDDNGASWSAPCPVAARAADGEVPIGKGLDSTGAALFWIRCIGPNGTRHELHRTPDGQAWQRVATLDALNPNPMQITDIFPVSGVGLMAFWFATDYKEDAATSSWGVMTSRDDGRTWQQHLAEAQLPLGELPAEPCGVYLGDGRILAIGRTQAAGNQFQLVSSDFGKTWRKFRTNISDISSSTPSLVYDRASGIVRNYYYWRGHRQVRLRTADARMVFDHPCAWGDAVKVADGNETEVPWDAGNVNVATTAFGDFAAYYSGTNSHMTCIYVKALPRKDVGR